VAAPVLGGQGEVDQGLDRPVGAQQRVGQLKQRAGPGGQAAVEASPEPGQHGQGLDAGSVLNSAHDHSRAALLSR
jgi:hypothetical protein